MKVLLFIFTFLFLSLNSFAQDEIISKLLISKDSKNYLEPSKIGDEIYESSFFVKVFLDKNVIKDKEYYLRLTHNYKTIKNINAKSRSYDNEHIILIDKNTKSEIVIAVDNTYSIPFLNLSVFNADKYQEEITLEKTLFGFSYGIIFCAFLYNFILYIYNRKKSFLYYSFLQISLLCSLILMVSTPDIFKLFYEYILLPEFFVNLSLTLAILFNKTFLDLKYYFPKWDKFLTIVLYVYVVDLIIYVVSGRSIVNDENIPTSILLFILLISGILVYKKGYKVAVFYVIGWSIIFVSVILVEFDILPYNDFYILHVAFPLESILLSFSLAYKMKELQNKKVLHEKLLIHQNKLASMGEMINNIAHQYRQPLTHLGYIFMNINSAHEHGELDKKYLDKKIKQANSQLEFMSLTIDNFRDFYKPLKEKEIFSLNTAILNATSIIKPILDEHKIELDVKIDPSKEFLGYENEYSQVILNLITNAKDALIEKDIKNPFIKIFMKDEKVCVEDNAGGVSSSIKEKIFEPYFTTKNKSSGIGLYMSSMIIQEHFDGKLYLEDTEFGSRFIIEIPSTKQ